MRTANRELNIIKKLIGWCPVCRKMAQQTKQFRSFANLTPISGKTGKFSEFRTSNVLFSANNTLFLIYFMISFQLLLHLKSPEDTFLFLAGLFLFNVFCYFLVLRTFKAAVLVDKYGIHFQAFKLNKFDLYCKDIESVTLYRLEKRSKNMSFLLNIGEIIFCVFVFYLVAVKGEWNLLLFLISLLLLMLFAERKQKSRFNLNT